MSKKTVNSTDSNSPKIEGVGITHGVQLPVAAKSKAFRLSIVVLALIFLGSIALFQFVANSPKCSDDLLQRGGSSIKGNRYAQLHSIANEVRGVNNYSNDINCLYIVLNDDITRSQTASAETNYEKLVQLNEDGKQFSEALGKDLESIKSLGEQVKFLKDFETKLKSSASGVIEP